MNLHSQSLQVFKILLRTHVVKAFLFLTFSSYFSRHILPHQPLNVQIDPLSLCFPPAIRPTQHWLLKNQNSRNKTRTRDHTKFWKCKEIFSLGMFGQNECVENECVGGIFVQNRCIYTHFYVCVWFLCKCIYIYNLKLVSLVRGYKIYYLLQIFNILLIFSIKCPQQIPNLWKLNSILPTCSIIKVVMIWIALRITSVCLLTDRVNKKKQGFLSLEQKPLSSPALKRAARAV
jgi:hypothetical protein